MSAHPTFPTASGKYHGIGTLSLLCSEWEEVGHARMKHRHQKAVRDVVPEYFPDRAADRRSGKILRHNITHFFMDFSFCRKENEIHVCALRDISEPRRRREPRRALSRVRRRSRKAQTWIE